MSQRKILVTSALPYANSGLHLGHILEQIQADIWVRFQRMRGHECYYVCAGDTHGTPIMLAAKKQGVTAEALVQDVMRLQAEDSAGFLIGQDNYYSTNSPENRMFVELVYRRLRDANRITKRTIEQLFDVEQQMFLPDRFVKGECPKCGAKDQYGDNCEKCGATYSASDMKNPYSAISGAAPVLMPSEHYFFRLTECASFLRDWVHGTATLADGAKRPHLQLESINKIGEWIDGGLQDWDISRDAPYFGFEIPEAPGKYFYVWLDAPLGYMASFKNLAERIGVDFDEYFKSDSTTELYHFIGKDIQYFHTLFWPAILRFSGHRTPTGVFVHGFVTIDGQKMSKSRGTFISARSYLDCGLNPEWLRYYFASKLNPHIEDIDLSLGDFIARVNSDLVGKYINIASRAAGFITNRFAGRLAPRIIDQSGLLRDMALESENVANLFEDREYGRVLREIMAMADRVNAYVDASRPWELNKQEGQLEALHEVCTVTINAFRLLTIYLKPVLPDVARHVETFLGVAPLQWSDSQTLLRDHLVNPYKHLMRRIDKSSVDKLIEANERSADTNTSTI